MVSRTCLGTWDQDSTCCNNSLSINALNGQLVSQPCSAGAARLSWFDVQVAHWQPLTIGFVRGSTPYLSSKLTFSKRLSCCFNAFECNLHPGARRTGFFACGYIDQEYSDLKAVGFAEYPINDSKSSHDVNKFIPKSTAIIASGMPVALLNDFQ